MRVIIITILLTFFLVFQVHAQKRVYGSKQSTSQLTTTKEGANGPQSLITLKDKEDSLKPEVQGSYLSAKAFSQKVKNIFGQLALGQSSSGAMANYASADITDGKLGFNGVLPGNGRLTAAVAANGKINNSISELFSGFKLNTSTSIDVRVSLRLLTRFFFSAKDGAELKNKREYLEMKRTVFNTQSGWIGLADSTTIKMLAAKMRVIRDSMDCIRRIVNPTLGKDSANCDKLQIDRMSETLYQLILDSGINKLMQDSLNLLLKEPGRINRLRKVLNDSIDNESLKVELAAPFESFHLVWLSGRFTPSRQRFFLYDSTKSFDQQVKDTAFTTSYSGLELNYYYWSKQKDFSLYINVGAGYSRVNNLDTLTNYSLDDTRTQSAGLNTRKLENKYSAYSGQYLESSSFKIYSNLYLFGSGNKWAIHFFPEWVSSKGLTVTNLGAGFVLSFKSKKDDKTTINAEPYIQWTDIGNKLNGAIKASYRNIIGIRVGLPINPPTIK